MSTLLILGANSEIGQSIAKKFANNGWDIQLASRDLIKLKNNADTLAKLFSVNITTYFFDVLQIEEFSTFIKHLSVIPDVVLTAIGIYENHDNQNIALFQKVINTNFTHNALIISMFADIFEQRKMGAIIGISSVAACRPHASNYLYAAAKSGFSAFMYGLQSRLRTTSINVILVIPGYVKTAMIKNKKLPLFITASPDEVADDVYNGYLHNKNVIYSKWYWRYMALIIRILPNFIFKRLFKR